MDVPADFTGTQMTVPHPVNGLLYLKLRDDPETVQTLALSVLPATTGVVFWRQSRARRSRSTQSAQSPPQSKTEP